MMWQHQMSRFIYSEQNVDEATFEVYWCYWDSIATIQQEAVTFFPTAEQISTWKDTALQPSVGLALI